MAQSFQDWLIHILDAIRPSHKTELGTTSHFPFIDGISPAHQHLLSLPELPTNLFEKRAISCQKLLFSATLTRDPGKTAALELRDPKYFIIQEREMGADESGVLSLVMEKFSMPTTLKVGSLQIRFPVSMYLCTGTHAGLRIIDEAPHVFLSRPHAFCDECAGFHQVRRIYNPTCPVI